MHSIGFPISGFTRGIAQSYLDHVSDELLALLCGLPYREDIAPPQRGSLALKDSSERFYQDAAKPPVGLNQEVLAHMNTQYLNINSKPLLYWVFILRFPINKL